MNDSILVVGDALLDWYTYAHTTRQSPEEPEARVWDVDHVTEKPGGALNVAANLAALRQSKIDFAGILEYDFEADLLPRYNVDPKPALCHCTDVVLIKERLIDLCTNRQIARIDNNKRFQEEDTDCFELRFLLNRNVLNGYGVIVVSDYGKGTVSDSIIQTLSHFEGLTFVDTKRPNLDIWSGLQNCIVKINNQEFLSSSGGNDVRLIVTKGAEGAHYFDKGEFKGKVHGVPVKDADCVGAGDSYLAGLVDGFLYSQDILEAMKIADLVARASVRKKGTSIVHARDIGSPHINPGNGAWHANDDAQVCLEGMGL